MDTGGLGACMHRDTFVFALKREPIDTLTDFGRVQHNFHQQVIGSFINNRTKRGPPRYSDVEEGLSPFHTKFNIRFV